MIPHRKAALTLLKSAGYAPELDPWGDITLDLDGGRIWVHIWARSEYPHGPRRVRRADICATGKCPVHERRAAALAAARRLLQAMPGLEEIEAFPARPLEGAAVWTAATGWRPLPVRGPRGRLP
jgi:hypothetical protein